jgi:hypothetical protein
MSSDITIGTVLGVVTGVLSSWLFWLYTARILRPRIEWSPRISKYDDPGLKQPVKYRVEIRNRGRRAATDFSATALFKAPGLGSFGNTKLVRLRTLDIPLPYLAPGRSRIITIKTDGLPATSVSGLPERLRKLLNADPPTPLEELFRAVPGSELVLHLAAHDAVSGMHRHFVSKAYRQADITGDAFRGTGSKGPM